MKSPTKDLYLLLEYDPLTTDIVIAGFAGSPAEARENEARAKSLWFKTVLLGPGTGPEVIAWLRTCGVPESIARQIVSAIGKALLELMNSKQRKKSCSPRPGRKNKSTR